MAGKHHLNRMTGTIQSKLDDMAAKDRLSRLAKTFHDWLDTDAGKHRVRRLTGTFQSRQGAVASTLVAGAVATTALTVATQAPAQAAVGAAAPITTLSEGGKAAKSLTGAEAEVLGRANADSRVEGKAAAGARAVKADDVIRVAKTQVGVSEDGSGKSKFGRWYASTERAKETVQRDGGSSPKVYEDAPWCAMFLAWTADQAGVRGGLGEDPYTVTYAQSFKDKGRWGTTPRPGAVVFFDWDGGKRIGGIDHVGLVAKVLGNGKIQTVEGNISDSVVSKVRTSDIVGYGYPDYAK